MSTIGGIGEVKHHIEMLFYFCFAIFLFSHQMVHSNKTFWGKIARKLKISLLNDVWSEDSAYEQGHEVNV